MIEFKSIEKHTITGRGDVYIVVAQSDENLAGKNCTIDGFYFIIKGVESMGKVKAGDKIGLLVRQLDNGEESAYIKTDIEKYLEVNFTPCDCYTYKSKKKRIGAGTGDDSTLHIYAGKESTMLWWKENRGYEKTIFEGRGVRSIEELENIFDLLDIKRYLKC